MTPGSEALVSSPLRGYGDYILWMLKFAEAPGRDVTLGGAAPSAAGRLHYFSSMLPLGTRLWGSSQDQARPSLTTSRAP